jgi:hypothetical protein
MKRIAIFLALSFSFFPCARAQQRQKSEAELRQEAAEAAEADLHRQELFILERETAHAVQLNNASFFQRVFDDEYVGTNEHGMIVNKSELVRGIQKSETTYASVVISDVHVRFFRETAVVQSLWSVRGAQRGLTFSRQLRVIHVYINGPRGWQVVAGQQTQLPGEGR